MTDFGIEGFDPRRVRSERIFWVYVIGSVLAHVAIVSWLVSAGVYLPASTPAILVRLISPEADVTGGGGEPAGGPSQPVGPAQPAAMAAAALPAPTPAVANPAFKPAPALSPVKEKITPPAESEPSAPILAAAPAQASNTPALGIGPSGPNGAADGDGNGSGPGGSGGVGDGSGAGPGDGTGGGLGGSGPVGLPALYLSEARSRIMRNRHYPEVCRDNNIEGTVRVRVTINPDGQVAEVKLVHSSGSEELDRAGLAAIEKTSFPPFPSGLDLPPQRITVPVDFSLNH